MTTYTTALIMPPNLTHDDVRAAAYTLGQVLLCNPELPREIMTEAWTAQLVLDRLAPPMPFSPPPVAP